MTEDPTHVEAEAAAPAAATEATETLPEAAENAAPISAANESNDEESAAKSADSPQAAETSGDAAPYAAQMAERSATGGHPQLFSTEESAPVRVGRDGKELRTVYLAGIPGDATEREVYLFFRSTPGYVDCTLRMKNNKCICFALFDCQKNALSACESVSPGTRFEPNSTIDVSCELAKTNLILDDRVLKRDTRQRERERSRGDSASGSYVDDYRRQDTVDEYRSGYDDRFGSRGRDMERDSDRGDRQHFRERERERDPDRSRGGDRDRGRERERGPEPLSRFPAPEADDRRRLYGDKYGGPAYSASKSPPCNTLFVSGIGKSATEEELEDLFGRVVGFRRLKLVFHPTSPCAFVEYDDEPAAATALMLCNAFRTQSCESREGIRVEYAKNRMGQPSRFRHQ